MKAGKSSSTPDTADQARLTEFVRVRGAREHDLKNGEADIPRRALVVFTGVSGSGRSSLAFGTLYAEAQQRYQEGAKADPVPLARRGLCEGDPERSHRRKSRPV